MTIHQLYDGGPANSTISRNQWPAYPFSASDPALAQVDVASHYGSGLIQLRKTLDFANDYELQNYFNLNQPAVADVLNLILLPSRSLLLGLYVEVEYGANNGTALTATFGTAGGLAFGGTAEPGTAVDLTAVAAYYGVCDTAWATGTGATVASLAKAYYLGTQPDMVQLTIASNAAAAGLVGFSGLRLNMSASILQLRENPASNYPNYQ